MTKRELSQYPDLEYIGEGKCFQSFTDPQHTTVYKFSLSTYTREVAQSVADVTRCEYELLVKSLGSVVIDTEVSAISDPKDGWKVVQVQPFVDGMSVDEYLRSGFVNQETVEAVSEVYRSSIQMKTKTSHMPDIWGRPRGFPRPFESNNLLITVNSNDVKPVLVDTNFGSKQRDWKTRAAINGVQAIALRYACHRLSQESTDY